MGRVSLPLLGSDLSEDVDNPEHLTGLICSFKDRKRLNLQPSLQLDVRNCGDADILPLNSAVSQSTNYHSDKFSRHDLNVLGWIKIGYIYVCPMSHDPSG